MIAVGSPSKDDLRRYMQVPVWRQRRCLELISHFMRDTLGFRHAATHYADFAFCFDENNTNVAVPKSQGPVLAGEWLLRIWVSGRGPLITYDTLKFQVDPRRNVEMPNAVYAEFDSKGRPQATDWVTQIAQEFDLRYVEAQSLRDWPIAFDEVDPAFEDELQYIPKDEPNAFQVLFLAL
jgi:hypothetical protein